jgi:hypothetical protein
MGSLDMDWVKQQIQAAKVRKPVGDATLKLVEIFSSFENLTDDAKEKTIKLFSKVALGHAWVENKKHEVWVPVRPGDIKVSEVVRVRSDAFTGELGRLHNGRQGVVVGVRYGDVIVKSNDGKVPALQGAHYSPYTLEKLIVQTEMSI